MNKFFLLLLGLIELQFLAKTPLIFFRRVKYAHDFQLLSQQIDEEDLKKIIEKLRLLNFKEEEISEAISEVAEFIKIKKVPYRWWPQSSNAGMTLACLILALSLNKESHLLHESDLLEKLVIFNGKSLGGLRAYFRNIDKEKLLKRFSHLKEEYFTDPDLKRFYVLFKALKIGPTTAQHWIECIASYTYFNWAWLRYETKEIKKYIIEKAFREELFPRLERIDKSLEYYNYNFYFPGEFIDSLMLTNQKEGVNLKVNFLGDKDLEGFYKKLHSSNLIQFKKYYGFYPDLKDKYLWINYIRNAHPLFGNIGVQWDRQEVPGEIITHLSLRVAQERGKRIEDLIYDDFLNLDFLGRKDLGWQTKGLLEMINSKPFFGMKRFRKQIIDPLLKKLREEIENIKMEILEKGRVKDWQRYSLWARKIYIEEEILKGKDWQSLKESELPEGFLNTKDFMGYLDIMKAILWIDLDLYERIFIHPITTEDWVTRLLFDFPILDWEKTPKGFHKDLVRMLAKQLNMDPIELLEAIPENPEFLEITINFYSDPLNIFSDTFYKLLPLMPTLMPTEDWKLKTLLNEVYNGDIEKLKKLFKEN